MISYKESVCPLCGERNECAAHSDYPCWCFSARIPQGLLDLIPEPSRNQACICRACAERYRPGSSDTTE